MDYQLWNTAVGSQCHGVSAGHTETRYDARWAQSCGTAWETIVSATWVGARSEITPVHCRRLFTLHQREERVWQVWQTMQQPRQLSQIIAWTI